MYQKYANGLPLYRQEKDWKQYGAQISRTTLANWIIYCSRNYLQPMYDYFHRELLKRSFAMADELCRASHNSSYEKYYIMQRIWGEPVK
ncbi:MAG: IS66 family transposase [Ruminococcus sp.]